MKEKRLIIPGADGGAYVAPRSATEPAVIVSASGHVHIHTAAPAKCEDCGALEELRPYGPGGKNVCFNCMMKDPEGARERFYQQFK